MHGERKVSMAKNTFGYLRVVMKVAMAKIYLKKYLCIVLKHLPHLKSVLIFLNIQKMLLYDAHGDFEKGKRVSGKFRSKRTHGT